MRNFSGHQEIEGDYVKNADRWLQTDLEALPKQEIQEYLSDPQSTPSHLLAKTGNVRVHHLAAHFTVAMLALANGQRRYALDHLERCLETEAYHHADYWWARAFAMSLRGEVAWSVGPVSDSKQILQNDTSSLNE